MSYEDYLFDYMHSQLAKRMETGKYNVIRPYYSTIDNSGPIVLRNIPLRVDVGAGGLLIEPVPGLPAYSVFTDRRNKLRTGDVLVPTVSGTDLPTMTIVQNLRKEELVAIKTNKVGTLVNTVTKTVHTNVMFDWYRPLGVGSSIIGGLPTSPEEEQRSVAIYLREGIRSLYRLIDDKGQRWKITTALDSGNILALTMVADVGG